MKKTGYKIGTLLFVFTLVFSTMSFSMNKNCCNELMISSNSVFYYAQDCSMQRADLYDNGDSVSQNIKSIKCCHNVKAKTIKQKALLPNNLKVQKVAIVVNFNSFGFKDSYLHFSFYQNYTSPFLVKNIPVLVQTFRI